MSVELRPLRRDELTLAAGIAARALRDDPKTDKPENVAFYRKFDFTVVGEAAVLGTATWLMYREPRALPIP